VAQKVRFELQ